ncbi:restriction endonuclease subunit S [Bacteroides fragilis]|uniref:restriction endonuclease subunit S n=1 Tax=Bacteroides fragilis TaxID=817 RepID=UPI000E4BB0C8|nr:restriction endonuclease subunit S [Bacteroides fragilis]MCE8901229.1 restriction endonuclease subunit S [Bacteroides fragilis]MCE9406724.1 restriction endonuclease subunit S [Bacteroides fragilis]RGZ90569.1 restriction endonuclease subunit S [Bacteroides stercoris]
MRFPEFNGEWETKLINDLAVVIGGGTPDTTIKSYWDGEIQWFTPSEIGKNKYVDSSLRTITEEGLNNSSAKLLPPNTILLSSRATIGECSLSLRECATNQGFQSLVSKKCYVDFLYYLIQTKKRDLIRKSCGSTFLEISANEVRKIQVSVPTDVEQQKIAGLLSLIDERIATQNKIIEKLQSLIKGLNDNIHKGIKGETVCFSDLGEAYSGLSGKGGDDFGYGEPFITYMNVYQNTYISEKDYELVQIAPNEKQNSVQYGDALFTLSSETPEEVGIGAVYLGNTQKLYLNSFCFGIHFYDERVLPQYLAHFISSSSFRRAIYPLAQGSTRFNLQKNDFMKMKFLLPSLEKQGHIANTLDALHCRLANEKSLTEQYILLKKYLLSLMFI